MQKGAEAPEGEDEDQEFENYRGDTVERGFGRSPSGRFAWDFFLDRGKSVDTAEAALRYQVIIFGAHGGHV